MRVAALGDAHLGRSYYPVATPEGVNVRERDFEESFEAAVAAALAEQPDLVAFLGDVFDHPRPTYRAFRVVQRALGRVRDHGVPAVVISGNHDTPRLPGTGSPYAALADAFPEHRFAYALRYERFEFPGLVVHAVPQTLSVEAALAALDQAAASRSLDKVNLLLTHPRLKEVEPKYADLNEIEVEAAALRSDLALLGHYHVHLRVRDGVFYAGATDTFHFGDEPEQKKGLVVLDTEAGTCRHVALEGQRPLLTPPPVDAFGLGPAELEAAVTERLAASPAGAVVRLFVDGVDPEAYRLLDVGRVREAGSHLLWHKLEPQFAGVPSRAEVVELDSMAARWSRYVAAQDLAGFDRVEVERLGREYLVRAVEEASSSR
jgi:DNA repair exonuclease SbcCD nuclease subunit